MELTLAQFYEKLGLQEESRVQPSIRVMAATAGKSISKIEIAGTVSTGREVRERLGLASAAFTWKMNDKAITITTYGYGHGVGMSQWGANGMAKLGYSAKDILTYYYTGALVEQASKFSGTLLGRSYSTKHRLFRNLKVSIFLPGISYTLTYKLLGSGNNG